MSREKSIAALIGKCRAAFGVLKSDYQSSLRAKNVSEELKIDIKNILENLRSCLGYIAHDVHDQFVVGEVPPKKWRLGKDQVHLERRQSDERAEGEATIHP